MVKTTPEYPVTHLPDLAARAREITHDLRFALLAVIVGLALGVTGFIAFDSDSRGVEVDLAIGTSYVPVGASELTTALIEPAVGVDFGAGSAYVPVGASELTTALI